MNYKHLIYDFDGTLSDTYPCFTETVLELIKKYGISDTYENVYSNLKVNVGYALKQYDLGNKNIDQVYGKTVVI